MKYKFLKDNKIRSFNKRSNQKYKSIINFKYNLNIIITKQMIFEYIYIKTIKIILKSILKYKYSIFKKFLFFFPLRPNLPISIKSKNSRMGKGIGRFLTWIFLIKPNSLFLSFGNNSTLRFCYFIKLLKKRISNNLKLVTYSKNF